MNKGTTIWGSGLGDFPPMENQMERKTENEMTTGFTWVFIRSIF